MEINLQDKKLCYTGRIDWEVPEKPEFIYPATSLAFRFFGKEAKLTVENRKGCWDNYVGAIVDKEQKCWKLPEKGEMTITLVEEAEASEHDILFFKRQDSCHELILKKLYLAEGSLLQEPRKRPERRIEVYGDSVSAGEVSEALEYVGKPDPEHSGEYSNSWYSYAWILARKLGAELHDIAQGGIPLLNGNGWVTPPVYPGMESVWDKLHYQPMFGKTTPWNFSEYVPHLVIVAIGQNDSNPEDYMKNDPEGVRAIYWKYKYRELILKIREKYPKAVILLTTTILGHDKSWDNAIEEVCMQLNDDRIRHFLYKRNGCGTPGHIRIPEAEEMAEEMAVYVENLDIPVWEE